jgi:hypothetical protein
MDPRWRGGRGGGGREDGGGEEGKVRHRHTACAARPCRHIQRVVVPDAGCSSLSMAPSCRAWMGRRCSWREGGEASKMGSGGGRRHVGLWKKTMGAAGGKGVAVDAGRASGGGVRGEGGAAHEGGCARAEGGRESALAKRSTKFLSPPHTF